MKTADDFLEQMRQANKDLSEIPLRMYAYRVGQGGPSPLGPTLLFVPTH